MDQKALIEKWIKQIQTGQLNPEALNLGSDREKAIAKLKLQMSKISASSHKPKQ